MWGTYLVNDPELHPRCISSAADPVAVRRSTIHLLGDDKPAFCDSIRHLTMHARD